MLITSLTLNGRVGSKYHAMANLQLFHTPGALATRGAQNGNFLSVRFLRAARVLCVVAGLLGLTSIGLAQIEPAAPGSIEYGLLTNNYTWVRTSDPITVGIYVEDLLTDRWNQPAGRGEIGIVTATNWDWDPAYNEMAATVDFGRDYSAGIVFPELSAIQLIQVPEPSSLAMLLLGILLSGAVVRRPGRVKPNS